MASMATQQEVMVSMGILPHLITPLPQFVGLQSMAQMAFMEARYPEPMVSTAMLTLAALAESEALLMQAPAAVVASLERAMPNMVMVAALPRPIRRLVTE